VLRRSGDAIWEARLLKNRGFLLAERGEVDAAEPDLERARDLYARLGATAAAAGADYELARVLLARGNLPGCLAKLDSIDPTELPTFHQSALELLRAKALVAGRLTSEARLALDVAQRIWQHAGTEDPEGRLDVATLTLAAGDASKASILARRAQRSFAARGRTSYSARAAGVALAAAIAAGTVKPSGLRSGRRAAAILAAGGWRTEALRVRLTVARAAIELGSRRVARRELAACSALRRHGAVTDRIEAWHVEALVRLADSDHAGAQRAASKGLRLLDSHRAALGDAELRATASEIGVALARLGLRIALDGTDGSSMLAWAEILRASALRLPTVVPPDDPELLKSSTELRRIRAQRRRGELDGRPERSDVARQTALEAAIRRRSRHAAGTPHGSTPTPRMGEIARKLGTAVLIELIELDRTLTALVLVDGRLTRHELGSVAPVKEQLEWLGFALRRLARRGQSGSQRATMRAAAEASVEALAQRLLAPVAEIPGDRSMVIVPTGTLHAVPWSILPPLRGRSVVVSPSVVSWLTMQSSRRQARAKIVLVAGPRLRHAEPEVAALRHLYPDAAALTGSRATVAAVIRALDGATVAHLACHGRFRSDSPLFSVLELADGSLNAYDLQRLRRAPEVVVLSACDLATSDPLPGDELLGFAAALIAMGTRTIVASFTPVPDAGAKQLMLALHRQLAAGVAPSSALAYAQDSLRQEISPLAGFVCLGTS